MSICNPGPRSGCTRKPSARSTKKYCYIYRTQINCTSYYAPITDYTKTRNVTIEPVNKWLLVQGVRSGGEEGGLPRPAGGGTPVPVLLTQLLLKQSRFFLVKFLPFKKPVLLMHIADPCPHSFGCPGSGSVMGKRIRIREHGILPKFTNIPGSLPFKKAFFLSSEVCFWAITYLYFSCKNSTFCDQDPDPNPYWFGSLDPDPQHWFKKLWSPPVL